MTRHLKIDVDTCRHLVDKKGSPCRHDPKRGRIKWTPLYNNIIYSNIIEIILIPAKGILTTGGKNEIFKKRFKSGR